MLGILGLFATSCIANKLTTIFQVTLNLQLTIKEKFLKETAFKIVGHDNVVGQKK